MVLFYIYFFEILVLRVLINSLQGVNIIEASNKHFIMYLGQIYKLQKCRSRLIYRVINYPKIIYIYKHR